jgi:hypothetical protein
MNYILRFIDLYLNKVHNLVSLLRFIQKRKARHFLLTSASYSISYLFNEFVCNFGFFWHEWTCLKLE